MSGQKHGCGFEVIARDGNNRATKWLGTCQCGERFAETTYEATEDEWRKHYFDVTGTVISPQGDKNNRWTADVLSDGIPA